MPQARKLFVTALATAGLAFASSASALVVNWTAGFENGFEDGSSATWQGGPVDEAGATTVGGASAFTSLRWPAGAGTQSGLDVTPGTISGADVNVVTNGPTEDTVQVTHLNNIVGCSPRGNPDGTENAAGAICLNALKDTILLTQLTLTALDVDGLGTDVTIPFPTIAIEIQFTETFNQGSAAACGFPEQGGAETPCRDIFVVLNPEDLVIEIPLDVGDGETYFLEIGADGLGPLSDEACALAGVASGCIGLTTRENFTSEVLANIRIFTAPEPGTLAILALGLLAIGVVTRRKRA